jgi:hypothetical protein
VQQAVIPYERRCLRQRFLRSSQNRMVRRLLLRQFVQHRAADLLPIRKIGVATAGKETTIERERCLLHGRLRRAQIGFGPGENLLLGEVR